jgi:hypothetical protein
MNNNKIENDFSEEVQKVYLEWFVTEPDMFALCRNIIKAEYFDSELQGVAKFIVDYADENSTMPLPNQIKAKTGVEINRLPDELKQHSTWLIKEIERFCRTKALEQAVFSGVKLINENRGGELEKRIRDAMSISLITDLGYNYFKDDAFTRLEKMKDKSGFISTGWNAFDDKLYGGCSRATLNIFLGRSGEGKSVVLQNLALNYSTAGYNVVYFTLELAENLVAFRFDAMTCGKSTKEVIKDVPEVSSYLKNLGKTAGDLIIKKLPEGGTTVNHFKAFLKEYEIKTGKRFDVIIVDYLDLMYPTNMQVNPSDLFVKDKYVSEELRALAFEYDAILFTASQINRSGSQVEEFDHSHIAGGISKINTADNVFAIFAPDSYKSNGKMQFQFLKSRTSNAVGSKIDMCYEPYTMRITDRIEIGIKKTEDLRKEVNQGSTGEKASVADLMSKLRNGAV